MMFASLNCPFCGKNVIAIESEVLERKMGYDAPCSAIKRIWAKCTYCDAQGPKTVNETVYPEEEVAAAVLAWNRRAS